MSSGGDGTIGGSALLGGGLVIGGNAPGAGGSGGGSSLLLGAMPGGAVIGGGGGGGGTIGGGAIGGGLGSTATAVRSPAAVPSVPTPGKDATEAEKIEALMPLIVQLTNPDQVCACARA